MVTAEKGLELLDNMGLSRLEVVLSYFTNNIKPCGELIKAEV